jgi:hypothetical protein
MSKITVHYVRQKDISDPDRKKVVVVVCFLAVTFYGYIWPSDAKINVTCESRPAVTWMITSSKSPDLKLHVDWRKKVSLSIVCFATTAPLTSFRNGSESSQIVASKRGLHAVTINTNCRQQWVLSGSISSVEVSLLFNCSKIRFSR